MKKNYRILILNYLTQSYLAQLNRINNLEEKLNIRIYLLDFLRD